MSEGSINSINNVRSSEPVAAAKGGTPTNASNNSRQAGSSHQVKFAVPLQSEAAVQVEAANTPKAGAPAEAKPVATEKAALPVNNGSNVSIHFRVDDKTKDVTVYVVDRKSKKVLRTIPASELGKLSAGDLVKLTA